MSESVDVERTVRTLNKLLVCLNLPWTLEHPLDLVPSMILAIFESMLRKRLPISSEVRQSRSRPAKIEAMKIFLGVLGDDILGVDVGLEDVDPRKLADGEHDEVVYVAELLCWLGRKTGYISAEDPGLTGELYPEDATRDTDQKSPSPSTRSTRANSAHTDLFKQSTILESNTTTTTVLSGSEDGSIGPAEFVPSPPSVNRPRCIHEIEDLPTTRRRQRSNPTSEANVSYCDCPHGASLSNSMSASSRVRYNGWIEEINTEQEVRSFETWKDESTMSKSRSYFGRASPQFPQTPQKNAPPLHRTVTRHTSPTEHRLALLNERARLLSELAKFKGGDG